MKNTLISFFLLFFINSYSQNCNAIVNPESDKKIEIFDKPFGKKINVLKNDIKNEDFLSLTIFETKGDFFFVEIGFSIKNGVLKGWIKKDKIIGSYAKNYDDSVSLNLYTEPTLNSEVKSVVSSYYNELYQILDCKNGWVYVHLDVKGKTFEGWLQPDMQCANPYTTCN